MGWTQRGKWASAIHTQDGKRVFDGITQDGLRVFGLVLEQVPQVSATIFSGATSEASSIIQRSSISSVIVNVTSAGTSLIRHIASVAIAGEARSSGISTKGQSASANVTATVIATGACQLHSRATGAISGQAILGASGGRRYLVAQQITIIASGSAISQIRMQSQIAVAGIASTTAISIKTSRAGGSGTANSTTVSIASLRRRVIAELKNLAVVAAVGLVILHSVTGALGTADATGVANVIPRANITIATAIASGSSTLGRSSPATIVIQTNAFGDARLIRWASGTAGGLGTASGLSLIVMPRPIPKADVYGELLRVITIKASIKLKTDLFSKIERRLYLYGRINERN